MQSRSCGLGETMTTATKPQPLTCYAINLICQVKLYFIEPSLFLAKLRFLRDEIILTPSLLEPPLDRAFL